MSDPTESIRRVERAEINASEVEDLPKPHWTVEELSRDFEVLGFAAPYVVVRRRADGVKGSLQFKHCPRVYFAWEEDRSHEDQTTS